VALEIALVNPQ